MLKGATQFICHEGDFSLSDLDAELQRRGWLDRQAQANQVLAWRCGSNYENFLRARLAEKLRVPAMPVRFELARERAVLGEHKVFEIIEHDLELIEVPHLAEPLTNCSYLNMSSGTSSKRTIAFPRHEHIQQNAHSCLEYFELDQRQWYWCTFPFFAHAHEIFAKPIAAGTPIIGLFPTAIDQINAMMRKGKQKLHILTTPHVAISFLARHLNLSDPSRVRFELAGEYVSLGVVNRLQSMGYRVAVSWGSAETGGVAIADLDPKVPGSIGTALPGYQTDPKQKCDRTPLTVSGAAVAPYLLQDGKIIQTRGTFVARDEVVHNGQQLIFKGRNDRQVKFKGTYIGVSEVEGWAKSLPEVDNAFLHISENKINTELRLYIQCPQESVWETIRGHILRQMFAVYGGIRLEIQFATELAHTPTGKLIRDVQPQTNIKPSTRA